MNDSALTRQTFHSEACVRNNLSIGCWSVVGTGSAVVKALPDRVVAYGVPARVVRAVAAEKGTFLIPDGN